MKSPAYLGVNAMYSGAMKKFAIFLPLLALAACATPETRLRNGLREAGLSPEMSSCMAKRMTDTLSYEQLRKISSLSGLKEGRAADLSVAEFLHKLRALGDPGIVAETGRTAAICTFG